MKRLVKAALACVAAGGLVLVGTSSANAAPTFSVATTTTAMTEVYVSKTLGSIDATGEIGVLLSDGQRIELPAKYRSLTERAARTARSVQPDGTVTGNCGSSYITLTQHNGWPVHMDTGFHVNHEAISYDWSAQINGFSGSGYEYTYGASGDLDFDSTWHGQHTSHTRYPHGTYHAYVLQPSYALLDTGSICVSGDPYDYRNL